jgi:thioredoxin reductase (NADPH)
MDENYDVVVVGGGAAGLSGAVALTRSRRSVLVVDAGRPRNAPAGHVHNYLGRESAPPADLLADGRAELAGYGGAVVADTAVAAERVDGGFRVSLAGGRSVRARRLLVATGLVDELPDVPGLAPRWGRDVLHCPYCHGYEVRDRAIGVLATGPMAVHQALLFRQLSDDVVLFGHTAPPSGADQLEELAALGIPVVEGEVAAVEVVDDRLAGVRLRSGEVVAREALVVAPRFVARADLLATLGVGTVEQEMMGVVVGTYVPADPTGATAVPGVWVAGNVAEIRAQVVSAAAAGLNVGAQINADLIAEDARLAVAAHRERAALRAG